MDFIYNSVGATNGFDAYGHFLRSNLQLTSCVEVSDTVQSGCEAFFQADDDTDAGPKKKGKKAQDLQGRGSTAPRRCLRSTSRTSRT